ncbi:CBS domain-containing protein [Desulfofundulus thermosubterraneus]|uniref:CBS domain-containing protein n=1 Tax=Desulfofundulus thermosubterraneus DSM 16057 TaxID=1121432 RepID=A0A1M6C1F6_9FIRM|nr:CBS domain-containing protein [Desulfofundulus thermosubterraneus]SHI54832.1 CBS domain-containing protein [Desulfofundulus thermosubterraneus DSM 16057]
MPERMAKDIMVPISNYATVNADDCLKHALEVFGNAVSRGYRTLIVLDEHGNIVGFLTTRTILKALAAYGVEEDIWSADSWGTFFIRIERERLKNTKVKKVMRPVVQVFVDENTPIQEVARVILANQVNHIPVLNKERKVVGVVRTIDILDVLAKFLKD